MQRSLTADTVRFAKAKAKRILPDTYPYPKVLQYLYIPLE